MVFLQGPIAAVVAAVAAHGIVWCILPNQVQFHAEEYEPTRLMAVVEFLLLGVSYVLVYIVVARVVLYDGLVDLAGGMPRPLGRLMRRVLRLPDPKKNGASENESADGERAGSVDSDGGR